MAEAVKWYNRPAAAAWLAERQVRRWRVWIEAGSLLGLGLTWQRDEDTGININFLFWTVFIGKTPVRASEPVNTFNPIPQLSRWRRHTCGNRIDTKDGSECPYCGGRLA